MAVSETVAGWGTLLAVSSVSAAVIVNGVMGNYQDDKGQGYGAASNTTSVAIAAVSAAMVLPKVRAPDLTADGVTHGTVATKTFTITNESNITDAYVISAVTTTGGSVTNVVFASGTGPTVPATVGSTLSPAVPAGGSIKAIVSVATAGATIGSTIEVNLTAKTTAKSANGPQSDTGKVWIYIARGPAISGIPPAGSASPTPATTPWPVPEFVDGGAMAQAEPGAVLSVTIPFTNIGDSPATNVRVTDALPPQFQAVPGSLELQITGRGGTKSAPIVTQVAITGNTVTFTIAELDPGIDVTAGFAVTTANSAQVGTVVSNTATIAAQPAADVVTEPAVVLIGAMDVVFDALGGSGHPIAGAALSLVDPVSGQILALAATGASPNAKNVNPFTTSSSGTFAFTLPAARRADYGLYVTAPGYLNRRLKIAIGTAADGLGTTTISALDGLPLAVAGGFDLTANPVSVSRVTGFFGNVPMFAPQALKVAITADRSVASAGDRLAYAVDFGPGSKPVPFPGELAVALPAGVGYVHGTARLAGVPLEPNVAGRSLSWPVKSLAASGELTFDSAVLPGITEGGSVLTVARLSATVNGAVLSADANVAVMITGGALSSRSILTGRVFIDKAGDGHFAPGDTGVAGVRLFLEDGESVLTDHDGKFSFPAARPGMHALHLDPITLPPGIETYRGFAVNDPRSPMRLIHGIYDAGLMHDVNFAVRIVAGR